jgi:hypothetical protein
MMNGQSLPTVLDDTVAVPPGHVGSDVNHFGQSPPIAEVCAYVDTW